MHIKSINGRRHLFVTPAEAASFNALDWRMRLAVALKILFGKL
jgi:hypothetical protein